MASSASLLSKALAETQMYFPDVHLGTSTCHRYHEGYDVQPAVPKKFLLNTDMFETTIEECCRKYFSPVMQTCVSNSGGDVSKDELVERRAAEWQDDGHDHNAHGWWADYNGSQRCVRNCPKSMGITCGGYAPTNVMIWDTADDCCMNRYNWYQQDLCLVLAESGGTGHTGKLTCY